MKTAVTQLMEFMMNENVSKEQIEQLAQYYLNLERNQMKHVWVNAMEFCQLEEDYYGIRIDRPIKLFDEFIENDFECFELK